MAFSKKQKAKKEHRNIGLEAVPPKQKCSDRNCAWHGSLPVRGRVFTGIVKSSRAPKTAVVKWEHMRFIPKYERYERRHTRVVAHNPDCLKAAAGDMVRIAECRPISKTKTFVVVEVLSKVKV